MYLPLLPTLAEKRIGYLKKAGELYGRVKNGYSQINVLMHMGYQHFSIVQVSDAQKNFDEAIRIEDSLHWPYAHYTTDLLFLIALNQGNIEEEYHYALRSVKSAELSGDSLCLSTFYQRLASVYDHLPLFPEEYIYWTKKAIDRFLISDGELSIYQSATFLCGQLSESHRLNEMPTLIERIHRRYPPKTNVDSLYDHLLLRQFASDSKDASAEMKYALLAYKEGEPIELTRPFLRGQGAFHLGLAFFHAGDYKHAETLVRNSLNTPWVQTQVVEKTNAYRVLLTIDTAFGKLADAARDYHQFWTIDSTSFSVTQAKQVELLRIQYEVSEKEKNILLLETQSRLQKHKLEQAVLIRGISIGGIAVLIAILGLLYNRYRLKQRSNRQLQQQGAKIDRQNTLLQKLVSEKDELLIIKDGLMKELNHRVGNNLQYMMSVQNMQAHNLNNTEALNAIMQSNNRLYAMSLIHRKLYQPDTGGSIQMVQFIEELIQNLSEALSTNRQIKMEIDVASIELPIYQAIPIGLILNEAITNAYKYAFSDTNSRLNPDAGQRIDIVLQPINGDELELLIKDNGSGFSPDLTTGKQTSLGFVLMEMLAAQLGGKLTILNEGGLTVHIRFPEELQTFNGLGTNPSGINSSNIS